MSTLAPNVPAAWLELAAEWQKNLQQWNQWWLGGLHMPGASAMPGAGAASVAPLAMPPGLAATPALASATAFDPQALLELNARYAPRFEALWRAAQASMTGQSAAMPEV